MINNFRTLYLQLPPEFHEIISIRQAVTSWRQRVFMRFPTSSFHDIFESDSVWKVSIPQFVVQDWTMITNILQDLIFWKGMIQNQIWCGRLYYVDHDKFDQIINFGLKNKENKWIVYIKRKENFGSILGEHKQISSVRITIPEK